MKHLLRIFVFSLTLTTQLCLSNEEIENNNVQLYGVLLDLRLQTDGDTQYNELLSTMEKMGLEFDLSFKSLKRILREINQEGCIFPSSVAALKHLTPAEYKDIPLIESDVVDYVSLRVFTKPSSKTIANLKELDHKKIALWLGYDPKIYLNDIDVKVEFTPDEVTRIKMLYNDRVDAAIGFMPDGILAAEQLNLPPPHFHKDLALFENVGTSAVCHNTPKNVLFLSEFNSILKKLRESGDLRRILGPHANLEKQI